jgi:hypothetical protein
MRQQLMRTPSERTVQAPHWPWSQPFLVPVMLGAGHGEPFPKQIQQGVLLAVDCE